LQRIDEIKTTEQVARGAVYIQLPKGDQSGINTEKGKPNITRVVHSVNQMMKWNDGNDGRIVTTGDR
jgi:hypothetical protein